MGVPLSAERMRAVPSYDANGKNVGRGSNSRRLRLVGNDDRFAVATSPIPSGCGSRLVLAKRRFTHLPLDVDGELVHLSVRSVASRLHCTRDEVRDASREGGVVGLQRLAGRSPLAAIVENFDRIVNDPIFNRTSQQLSSRKWSIRISRQDLMRVVTTALTTAEVGHPICLRAETTEHFYSNLRMRCFVTRMDEDDVRLTLLGRHLASGAFSSVYEACHVGAPDEPIVYKLAKMTEANNVIRNEVFILDLIHQEGLLEGVIAPPSIYFRNRGIEGCILDGYSGDLLEMLTSARYRIRPASADSIASQLMAGIANVWAARLAYLDIKPENVLVRQGLQHDRIDAVLCDFGNAYDVTSPPRWRFSDLLGGHTPGYICAEDVADLADLVRDLPHLGNDIRVRELVRWVQRRQVFAFGALLFVLYTSAHATIETSEEEEAALKLHLSNHRVPMDCVESGITQWTPHKSSQLIRTLAEAGLARDNPKSRAIVAALRPNPNQRATLEDLLALFLK